MILTTGDAFDLSDAKTAAVMLGGAWYRKATNACTGALSNLFGQAEGCWCCRLFQDFSSLQDSRILEVQELQFLVPWEFLGLFLRMEWNGYITVTNLAMANQSYCIAFVCIIIARNSSINELKMREFARSDCLRILSKSYNLLMPSWQDDGYTRVYPLYPVTNWWLLGPFVTL